MLLIILVVAADLEIDDSIYQVCNLPNNALDYGFLV